MQINGRGRKGVRGAAGTAISGAIVLCAAVVVSAGTPAPREVDPETGSVIFIHPDGSGTGAWAALRLLDHGPGGSTHWDRMESLGFYRGFLSDSPVSSSQGGATTHAWGVKAKFLHYGTNESSPLVSLSGKPFSILMEAKAAGKAVGIVNSGHMAEPGTGVFAASAARRGDTEKICEQIIFCGADVIMAGGETLLLPEGVRGRHGEVGTRKDGRNLIDAARELGYTVVYDRDELQAVPAGTDRLLGVFAPLHTFNGKSEEVLRREGLPQYRPGAPTVAEMTEAALRILGRGDGGFMLVVEEEGTDNFGNANNAGGTMEALRRADAAIGVAMEYIKNHPRTLLITAADSDAGGMKVLPVKVSESGDRPLPARVPNGAPVDGRDGAESYPFLSAPDRAGTRFPFAVVWAAHEDLGGGVIARAHGLNADLLPRNVDNTDVYRLMYATLFGVWLP